MSSSERSAVNPKAAGDAYRTLGVSVTDTSGHLMNSADLLGRVSDKFADMQDGAEKTALAMRIFGREGATLIPLLNQGSEALKFWADFGTKVGAVLSEQAAKSAHEFSEKLTELGVISTGIQNQLMIALLPAIDHITQAFVSFASEGTAIKSFGEIVGVVLVNISKLFFDFTYSLTYVSAKLEEFEARAEKFANSHRALMAAISGGASEVARAYGFEPRFDRELDEVIANSQKRIQAASDHLAIQMADLDAKGTSPVAPEHKPGTKAAPIPFTPPKAVETPMAEKDITADFLAKTFVESIQRIGISCRARPKRCRHELDERSERG